MLPDPEQFLYSYVRKEAVLSSQIEGLLGSGRGSEKTPGKFRREQNWSGGSRPSVARYVPPPWQEVESAMSELERFLHDQSERTPILIKAALAHAQFESIHPFLDGNGRVGRLLITFCWSPTAS